ncbi:right-handed parallel beta-helix repeat-containing protein [Halosimplex sp. J119]
MSSENPDESDVSSDRLTFTRRSALALLGASGAGAAVIGSASAEQEGGESGDGARPWNQDVDAQGHALTNLEEIDVEHVYAAARDAHVVVWKDDEGKWHADGRDGHVTTTDDVMRTTNEAFASLTEDRDWKEKVAIVSPAEVGPHEWGEGPWPGYKGIEVPSNTILDVPVPIHVKDEGEPFIRAVHAKDAHNIEFPNLNIKGNPRYGVWMNSVEDVRIGHVNVEMADDIAEVGLGVRIDQHGDTGRSRNVQIESGFVKNSGHHAFETNGVTRFQAGQLVADNPANAGLNMDHTIDATINSVVGQDPGHPSTYATVRLANYCHNVSVGQVVSRGGAKGLMCLTAKDASFGEVDITGSTDSGIFIALSTDITISGGVVKNCRGDGIRIHGYPTDTYDDFNVPTQGITVSNVRFRDDRPEGERTQTYGIRESGETAFNNQFVNNDVRTGGTEERITVASASTLVANNVGAGIDEGTVTLTSGESPAARVPDVSPHKAATLDLRAKAHEAPDARFSWTDYFEWDPEAGAWELVVEWRTDPGEDVTLDYVVDRPQANLDRREYSEPSTWDENADEGPADPHR